MYWAARPFARGARVALLAAALLAINPMAIWYSQVARSYAFVVLAAASPSAPWPRALRSRSEPRGCGACYVGRDGADRLQRLRWRPRSCCPRRLLIVGLRATGAAQGCARWSGGARGDARPVRARCSSPPAIERSRRDPLYWLPKLGRGARRSRRAGVRGGFSEVKAVGWLTLLVAAGAGGARRRWPAARGAATRRRRAPRAALAVAAAWGVLPPAGLLRHLRGDPAVLAALCDRRPARPVPAARARRRRPFRAADPCAGWPLRGGAAALPRPVRNRPAGRRRAAGMEAAYHVAPLRARRPREPLIVDSVLMLPSLGYYYSSLRAATTSSSSGNGVTHPCPRACRVQRPRRLRRRP